MEIQRGRQYLSPHLCADPAFIDNSDRCLNWRRFEAGGRRMAGFLGDWDYLRCKGR
jgi:hypothetical protein